jgi:DNA-binding transcriptional MocR family regulator
VPRPLYQTIADTIANQITKGILREGEKLPSVRSISRHQNVSVATAVQAYVYLEQAGYAEARPRSGYYARLPKVVLAMPQSTRVPVRPTRLSIAELAAEAYRQANDPKRVPLGAAAPASSLMPCAKLNTLTRNVLRTSPSVAVDLGPAEGFESLRRSIARYALRMGCNLHPRDIVVTNGTLEAVNLALRAVARPGGLVAVESPTYFGVLQAMEGLGLRAVEIPAHPQTGLDLDALHVVLSRHPIAALVTMSCLHNPLGSPCRMRTSAS